MVTDAGETTVIEAASTFKILATPRYFPVADFYPNRKKLLLLWEKVAAELWAWHQTLQTTSHPVTLKAMTKLTFFHHKRRDAAVRTGIEINEELVLTRFLPSGDESNSALLWYVDVRCTTTNFVECDATAGRKFFSKIAAPIKAGLGTAAENLQVGIDADGWPIRQKVSSLPPEITVEIVCSAMRRIADGEISQVLTDLAAHWEQIIEELKEPVETVH